MNISLCTRERYEMHANKLNKWLPMDYLSAESRVTCVAGSAWWVKSSQSWQAQELLVWFLDAYWDTTAARIATEVIRETTWTYLGHSPVGLNGLAKA